MSERELWCAVLQQNFEDALGRLTWGNEQDPAPEARRWIEKNTRGFQEVATMAGLDPHLVRQRYFELRPEPARSCQARIRELVHDQMRRGKGRSIKYVDDDAILKKIRAEYPDRRITPSHVSCVKTLMRREGIPVPKNKSGPRRN